MSTGQAPRVNSIALASLQGMIKQNEYTTIQMSNYKLNKGRKELHQNVESLFSAFLYGVCSTSMAFANKAVLTSYDFDFPFCIMAFQMILCIAFLELLRKIGKINIPKYSMKTGVKFAWPSVFYASHSITALFALSGMSIPMYAAVKRCTPIITLLLSVVILKKKIPNLKIISSVFLISFGCILAGFSDFHFDMTAYAFGGLSILVQGLYLTLAQKSLEDMSALHVLYINSYNTLPFYIFICIFDELQELLQYVGYSDVGFIFSFGIQTSMGVLLNYSLFLCTAKNSALTTSLVGVLKSILQTVIGFFTFGGIELNAFNIFGISLNTIGGIMYSYSKYIERHKIKKQTTVT